MLLALTRLGASFKLFTLKGPASSLPQLSKTHLCRTRLPISRLPTISRSQSPLLQSCNSHLTARLHSTLSMFKQAVQSHNAAIPPPASNVSTKQQSLGTTFGRLGAPIPSVRPLVSTTKHNGAGRQGSVTMNGHGIKRTSTGLAKNLSTNDDPFDYPSLNSVSLEKENSKPPAFNVPARVSNASLATALFDEDDFDSDIDLDVEDPATKGTVSYPKLPQVDSTSSTTSKDEGYQSRASTIQATANLDSSQPIPWSSSPLEHFKTPQKPESVKPKSRRGFLPWSQNQQSVSQQPEDEIDCEEEEEEDLPPKKRLSTEGMKKEVSTPKPKPLSQYAWNTTASAVKEQQKRLREQNKKQNDSVDSLTDAVKKRKKNTVHRIFLSEEQQNVLNLVTEHKKSVFFTGSAGTGKSVLLREIIAGLRRKYSREPDRVAVTASTGLAACNIGGVTLHSFAGIGLGKEPAEDLVKKIRRNAKARMRWMRTKVLIMDEVSMVDGDLFDKLEQIARTIRNNGRPFGGIQLVITGDFFQLPPVPESGRASKFAFDAGTWTTSIDHTIGLHHVFRQKDPVFANMLNEMREGRLSADSIARFRQLERPLPVTDDNIEATELFPTRLEVDRANNVRMQQLHGSTFTFEARDGGTIAIKEQRDRLLQNCMVPEAVHLKKGAQVMLVKNMDDTLVNGSLGKVTGFMTEQMFNLYKEDEEVFLENGPSEQAMKNEMAKTTLGLNTAQVFPVVRFAIADGTTRDLLCKREEWKVELPNGEVQASRSQIPLILAWALSIHKAQGQTLERVRVDLGRVFEKGQAYVALSRATHMAGLQIMRFDPRKVIAHEKVRTFYSSLSKAEQVESKVKSKTILGKMQAANAKKRSSGQDE